MAEKASTPKRKETADILVSVLRYKNKVVSAIGIKDVDYGVAHSIERRLIPNDGWFDIANYIQTSGIITKNDVESLIGQILGNVPVIKFPRFKASEIKNIVDLKHDLQNVTVEL